MFHNSLVGDNLHISRIATGNTTPIGNIIPTIIGEAYFNLVDEKLYIAFGLTNSDWSLAGGGGGGGSTRNTKLAIHQNIPSGSSFSVISDGIGYTKSKNDGFLGYNTIDFSESEYIQIYLNGNILDKDVEVAWISETSFVLNIIVDNDDILLIIS
jgi:hypothetical protein